MTEFLRYKQEENEPNFEHRALHVELFQAIIN